MDLASSRRGLEKFEKRFRLAGEFADAVKLFSAHYDDRLASLFDDALRAIGAHPSEQLTELRFRFVQLPHSRIAH